MSKTLTDIEMSKALKRYRTRALRDMAMNVCNPAQSTDSDDTDRD